MSTDGELGTYFWRGGKKINITKEHQSFTAHVDDESKIKQLKSLPKVYEVKPLIKGVMEVNVAPEERDNAMNLFRAEDRENIAHHIYVNANSPATHYYITDKIIVKFHDNTSKEEIESILSQVKVMIRKEYLDLSNTFLVQVTINSEKNPIKIANLLAENERVEFAEPNLITQRVPFYIPNDFYFGYQWPLRSWNGPEIVANADISATQAWDITRGKREVVVALIDDGFDITHPDFSGEGKLVYPKDYVDGDSSPFPQGRDYHGTPCAGLAIAEENGEGIIGIAPGCAFMPVRFPYEADDDLVSSIFDYVGRHADVISCSWGLTPGNWPISSKLSMKLHQLTSSGGPRKRGCVIVFAAGNYNCPISNIEKKSIYQWRSKDGRIMETTGPILFGDAAHPDVITVSACTSINRKAIYSNWGKEISVCAPSSNYHPLDRSVKVKGRPIWTIDNEIYGTGFTPNNQYTSLAGGTSSSTPLVAGVAALVISENPNLNAKEVRKVLEETADKITDDEPDIMLNVNKGNYDQDGHSEWFGFGKINAYKAVQMARDKL